MTTALTALTKTLATKLDMGDGRDLVQTLKATAFKGDVSDAQMTALMVVANQYGLNPWTREIYAFPDKNNGIVPVVGVDGWARIINNHPQFDGMDFEQDAESCTCIIHRKDRSHPIRVTEWLGECLRGTGPWRSHPKRMLRHKAMIQCARLAFGYGGIYDQDEAESISDHQTRHMGAVDEVRPTEYPQADFDRNVGTWAKYVVSGRLTEAEVIAKAGTKAPLTDKQKDTLHKQVQDLTQKTQAQPQATTVDAETGEIVMTYAEVADKLHAANDPDQLAEAGSLIATVNDEQQRVELTAIYEERAVALEGAGA